ncbi:MAG: septum formation initiator family protein [Candidatus Omnitrophica bacterium]|nr:septum formation initiator family protein [Candidatus Omnitrophota bacterium]
MRKSFLFLWLTIAGLILFFWFYFPSVSHYRDLKIEEDTLRRELGEMDEKIRELTRERDLLKNDMTYLEKVIRDELGLVKPGEIVYKFVPDNTPKTPPPPAQDREAEGNAALNPETPLPSPSISPSPIPTPTKKSAPVYPRQETR